MNETNSTNDTAATKTNDYTLWIWVAVAAAAVVGGYILFF